MSKISASEFGTSRMHRQFCAFAYEFHTMITQYVVYGVYHVLIQSSFDVIRRHKVSGGTWRHTNLSQ